MYFYDRLKQNQHTLNETESFILDDLLQKKNSIKDMTIRQVAQNHFTAPNTITRLCKKLGFKGFTDFREALYQTEQTENDYIEITSLDEQIVKTKQLVNMDTVNDVLDAIHHANRILFFAVGLSRLPADELDARLQLVGKHSQTFLDPHVMKYNAELLTENDLAIAISLSGETDNILKATTIAQVAGAKTLSITGFSTNSLAKQTDFQLYGFSSDVRVNGIDATDRFSVHYLINLLFTEYLKRYHSKSN
ncbi:transcriptional regulator, RpiR family [Pelagirhabdus alkalitolerans]|uniref:Transcriptional regulator, RpiR family n=1 Tax=Pelagirhabdus alkalitolerans TaxID=1612202 RepID=A0A1G6KFR5_9BACI|nr:MurR/RpiR family transcriptional regulator [Pelagirhabdus alkalitolerans]SDC29757.1 transcriptional regulator, RpiR family [Pelagirhabdus alkalitolerans]